MDSFLIYKFYADIIYFFIFLIFWKYSIEIFLKQIIFES